MLSPLSYQGMTRKSSTASNLYPVRPDVRDAIEEDDLPTLAVTGLIFSHEVTEDR